MIRTGGNTLPKGDPALVLGAPFAPPPPLLTMPPSGGPLKAATTPRAQASIKQRAIRVKKAAIAAKKADDALVAKRQDAAVKRAILGRVQSESGLTPRSAPFGPVLSGLGRGSQHIVESETTANSALAHARASRLLNGGLLPPEATKREDAAIKKVGSSRQYTFTDRHPPVLPHQLRVPLDVPLTDAGQKGLIAGFAATHGGRPPPSGMETDPTKPGWFMSQEPAGTYGQGTQKSLSQFSPVSIQAGIESALGRLRADPTTVPKDIYMSPGWLKDTLGKAFNDKAYGSSSNPAISLNDFLTDEQKYGKYNLGVKTRKDLTVLMVQRGWNAKDAPNLTDQELAARAFNDNVVTFGSMMRNAAGDLGVLTSLPAFGQQVGEAAVADIRNRNLHASEDVGRQFLQQYANLLPKLADRPYWQVAQEHPLGAAVALMPFAKFASARTGALMGLKPFREVELPAQRRIAEHYKAEGMDLPEGFSTTREIPASVHPLARGGQWLHDVILNQATTPNERANAARGIKDRARDVPADVARMVRNPVGVLGEHLEGRIAGQDTKHAIAKAQLTAGQNSHVDLIHLHNALRRLDWLKNRAGGQGKEDAQRSIVFHNLLGKSSQDVEAFYRKGMLESQRNIDKWTSEAEVLRGKIHDAKQADAHAFEIQRLESDLRDTEKDIEKTKGHIVDQERMANWVRKNPHDPAFAKPDEATLGQAARDVAERQDELLRASHRIDQRGSLFGRLQHHMAITHSLEGPHIDEHGNAVAGTPLWREADRMLHETKGLRWLHNQARELLHEQQPGDNENPNLTLPASHDLYSPEAHHQLGRVNRLTHLKRAADAILRQREHRAEQRRQRAEGAVFTGDNPSSLAIAQEHAQAWGLGTNLTRAVNDAAGQMRVILSEGEAKAARSDSRAEALRGKEAGAHTGGIARRLRAAYHELKVLKDQKRPVSELNAKQRQIDELHRAAAEDFKPSPTLLRHTSDAEKTRLATALRQLPSRTADSAIDRIIDKHFDPQQVDQIGRQVLRDAIQERLESPEHLQLTHQIISQKLDEAKTAFELETGKKTDLALEYQRLSQHYLQRLRAYDSMIRGGDDPTLNPVTTGHVRLQHPDEPDQLPSVRITQGTQFARGDFERDVHLYLAKDLEGLTAQAVQGKVYEYLADTPWIITDAFPGDVPPPGFHAIPWDEWLNLSSPHPDPDLRTKTIKNLQRNRPEPVEGKPLFMSARTAKDFIEAYGNLHQAPYGMNWLLKLTNGYRRWMLYTLPRTLVNNALGNPIIAMIMGGKLRDLRAAVHILNHHPEAVPGTMRGRGPLTNALRKNGLPINGWRAMWRHMNTVAEDTGNLMVYLSHARKAFKSENDMKWYNRVSATSDDMLAFLKKAAKGENPDEAVWADKAAQAFGDMHDHWRADPALATTFLFHRWVAHMIYFTLWSMPVHYPGRTAFLWNAAELADLYQKKHGVYPEWARGLLRIPGLVQWDKLPTGLQKVLWTIGTTGVNPFATPGQTIDLGDVSQPKFPGQAAIAANLSPLFRVPLEAITGHRLDTLQPFKDRYGDDFTGFNWREGVQNVIANTPGLNTIWTRGGLSDDSIQAPGFAKWPRYSSSAKYDPAYNSAQGFGHSWWQDLLLSGLGAAGLSVRPLDAQGVRGERQAVAANAYEIRQSKVREQHQEQANARTLNAMHSVQQRKDWFKKNDPVGFARGDWRWFAHPGDKP